MRAQSVNPDNNQAASGIAMGSQPAALPGPFVPANQARSYPFFDTPILPCALLNNRYTDSDDELPQIYTALEDYITGADNNGGIVEEWDRLYQMGVQAGLGHGISVFKTMLTTELKYSGRMFGRKLARDYVGQTEQEQADMIHACDFYERSAAKLTADNHIDLQAEIRGHMEQLNQTQAQDQGPTQSGVVSGYSVGPAAMEDANTPAMPGQPGHHLPDTHANLAVLAGVPTIGGLDLTQMDGFAGMMTNEFANAILGNHTATSQQNVQNPGAQSGNQSGNMFVFGADNQGQQNVFQFSGATANAGTGEANNDQGQATEQGAAQEASGGNSALTNPTPVLTETKDGRAVIKLVPENQ
jgi:hypothetical protein